MLSNSSFLHISAEVALLWCKLICTTLVIAEVPELILVLLEVSDPAPVAPSLVLATCSGRLLLPVSVLAWPAALFFSWSTSSGCCWDLLLLQLQPINSGGNSKYGCFNSVLRIALRVSLNWRVPVLVYCICCSGFHFGPTSAGEL